jgi:hypothetical protein
MKFSFLLSLKLSFSHVRAELYLRTFNKQTIPIDQHCKDQQRATFRTLNLEFTSISTNSIIYFMKK